MRVKRATFTMKSGTITGNTATSNSNGNGGNGGGVFVGNGATFNLSGSPTITGNTGSNVYLTENIKIKIAGALTEAASVGVTMASPGVFTSGLSGKGGVANFESDDPNYGVRLNDANDKTFTMPAYPVTVNATFAQKIEPPTASTGLVYNGSAQTGVATGMGYTLTENTGTDAGDYTATATLESGYIWNDVTTDAKQIPWSIGRKAVTVTAKDATKTYDGSALTENGFTATALETGDTHTFTVAMTAGSTITNAGTQSNVIATVDGVAVTTGTATEVGNYKVTTVNGTLTVEQKSITGATVTLSATELTYNGAERSVTVTGVKLDDVTLTAGDYDVSGDTKGTNEGTYTVTVTGKGNYKDTASETWKITPKAMDVSVPDVTKNYDGNGYGIAVKVNDPASGATIKYGKSQDACNLDASPTITNVSDSPLTVYFKVTAENYEDYTGSAKVTISPKELKPGEGGSGSGSGEDDGNIIIIELDKTPFVYDGEAKTPAVTVKDKVTDDIVPAAEYTVTYANNVNAGTATVTITDVDGGNYIVSGKKTFEIARATLTVTAELKSKKEGEADPALTYTVTGLIGNDKLTGALTRQPGEAPGSYGITQDSLATPSDNDTLRFTGSTLIIYRKSGGNGGQDDDPDSDISVLATLRPGADGTSLEVDWISLINADGFDIFFTVCGPENPYQVIGSISAEDLLDYNITGLNKGQCYKAYIQAWRGTKDNKTCVGKPSPKIHAIVGGSNKTRCNAKKVKARKSAMTLKVGGKKRKIRASVVRSVASKKVLKHVKKYRYFSTNRKVAIVSAKGKVKPVGAGTCTIFVLANNGVYKEVTVTVE